MKATTKVNALKVINALGKNHQLGDDECNELIRLIKENLTKEAIEFTDTIFSFTKSLALNRLRDILSEETNNERIGKKYEV